MAFATMTHEVDPAEAVIKELGDLSGIDVFHNQVLLAVYQRPEKTKSGLYLSQQTLSEDRYQSKVGLVVKKGPIAFVSDGGGWQWPVAIEERDWVLFRPSDGWAITVNGILCRMVVDTSVKGKLHSPDLVW